MKRFFLTAVLMALTSVLLMAQSSNDYRTRANGNWQGGTTWERFDGSTWMPAGFPSASSAALITILHEVIVTTTASVDQAVIASGGKLILSGSSLTTADGPGHDLTIAVGGVLDWRFGNITINSTGGTISNNGTVTVDATTQQVTQNGSGTFLNNGNYTKTGTNRLLFSSTNFINNSGGTLDLQDGEWQTFGTDMDFKSGSSFTGSNTALLNVGASGSFNLAVSTPSPFIFPTRFHQAGGATTINTPGAVQFPNDWTQLAGATVTTTTAAQDITVTPAFIMNGIFNGPGDLTTLSHFTNNATFNGGTLTVGGNITINANITATNGTILSVAGAVHEWQGGTLSRNLTVDAGEQLLLTSSATKTLSAANVLSHAGTGSWTGGSLANNGTIQNAGSFTVTATTSQLTLQSGGTFQNNGGGSFIKQGPGRLQFSSTNFNNNSGSLLQLEEGELQAFNSNIDLKAGSSFTGNSAAVLAPGTGTFTVSIDSPAPFVFPTQLDQLGGTMIINTPGAVEIPHLWEQVAGTTVTTSTDANDITAGQPFVMNGTFNGQGDLTTLSHFTNNATFNGGTLTVGGNMIINGNITPTNGTILSVAGALHEWQGGTLSRNLTVDAGESLSITSPATKTLSPGNEITASGTTTWTAGTITNSGTITNNGSFTAHSEVAQLTLNSPGIFNNNGSFTKSGLAKLQLSTTTFNNNAGATVDLQLGEMESFSTTIDFKSGSLFTGSSSAMLRTGSGTFILAVASPSPFVFPTQLHQLGGIMNISTPGAVQFPHAWTQVAGAVVNTGNAAQDVSVTPAFIMNGTFNGPGDLTTLSHFTNNAAFNGAALTVGGNITINSNINNSNSAVLSVAGTQPVWQSGTLSRPFNIRSGDMLTLSGAGTKTVDAGFIIEPGGVASWQAGALNINASQSIINNGTFDVVASASLSMGGSGTFTNNNSFVQSGAGTVNINIDFTNNATGMMSGSGTISTFASKIFSNAGTIAPGLPAAAPGPLTFNGDQPLSDQSRLEMNINGTTPEIGHDLLKRTGNIVLDGDLIIHEGSVSLNNPYRLIAVTNGTITGSFDLIDGNAYNYIASVVTEGTDSYLEVTPVFALPVGLVDFTGSISGATVVLQWKTASEINAHRFELERADGANGNFIAIGSVGASGNSAIERSYSFTDKQPLADINCYRLKMIDQDGSYEYSRKVVVRMKGLQEGITLYPNPVTNWLQVQLKSNAAPRMLIEIHDMSARLMLQKTVINAGNNLFLHFDVSILPAGIYTITIRAGKDLFSKQFIRQ